MNVLTGYQKKSTKRKGDMAQVKCVRASALTPTNRSEKIQGFGRLSPKGLELRSLVPAQA